MAASSHSAAPEIADVVYLHKDKGGLTMFRPILPPIFGFVEVLDSEGNHVYQKLNDTASNEIQKAQISALEEVVDALMEGIV